MFKTAGSFWAFVFAIVLVALGNAIAVGAMAPAQTLNLPETGNVVDDSDDDKPDVTARVARISFIRGEAKVRRNGAADWEKATLNLPLVEGDEIATDSDSRIEIQFDNYQHARLAENSFLKVAALKDEGVALSISLGSLNLRVTSFDKDKAYFEIDAPKTTLAVQKAGTFRIDAGQTGDSEIRMAAMDGGEGRVYSDNSGFTLKNGRSSRIFIDGANVGEWETADASRTMDEFDTWASDRDNAIAKRLRDAHYDKYYDRDIYGADDLDDSGDWVYSRDYGYVWRPYQRSLSVYADWSPYRYGHWRWVPPYGWTWINDEPWGWATYHHGRWIYDNGFWCWSPYGYYRPSRSWWSPALVVINIYNNNVCWYPLGYHHRYRNYNWNNNHFGGNNHNNQDPPRTGGIKPIPPAQSGPPLGTGGIKPIPPGQLPPKGRVKVPGDLATDDTTGGTRKSILDKLPPGSVIGVDVEDFGTTKAYKKAPPTVATAVLAKNIDDTDVPNLPIYAQVERRVRKDIGAEQPKTAPVAERTKVGAAERRHDMPMDEELRRTRVFGGRTPQAETGDTGGVRPSMGGTAEPRRTGAVDRPPVVRQPPQSEEPTKEPVYVPREKVRTDTRPSVDDTPRSDPPPTRQPPRSEPPPTRQPRYDPPRQQTPDESAPTRQPPRSEPPPTRQPPRSEPPPTRQPPKNDPPPKSDPKPPPSKPSVGKTAEDGS